MPVSKKAAKGPPGPTRLRAFLGIAGAVQVQECNKSLYLLCWAEFYALSTADGLEVLDAIMKRRIY